MPSDLIFHITSLLQWQQAQTIGLYRGDTLATEGFIHCSTRSQLVQTANRFFRGQASLCLLVIDPDRVEAEIRYEGLPDQELFPHIYGPLNLEAVAQVLDFSPGPEGCFHLPAQLQG